MISFFLFQFLFSEPVLLSGREKSIRDVFFFFPVIPFYSLFPLFFVCFLLLSYNIVLFSLDCSDLLCHLFYLLCCLLWENAWRYYHLLCGNSAFLDAFKVRYRKWEKIIFFVASVVHLVRSLGAVDVLNLKFNVELSPSVVLIWQIKTVNFRC